LLLKSTPTDHNQGPWCPTNITDDATKGGIWIEGGNVYDVDGAFVKNLATFYKDNTWKMYNTTTGVITKTSTYADCQRTPNVGAAYKNYCVECLPSYVSSVTKTIYIPITYKIEFSCKFWCWSRSVRTNNKRNCLTVWYLMHQHLQVSF
jgi:hypothetical protein